MNHGGIRADWAQAKRMLWGGFWKQSGSKKLSKLPISYKFMLLQRSVFSLVLWKLSRWPYQRSIAVELDSLMCHFARLILPCFPKFYESVDDFDRRRKREARDFCTRIGLWSTVWAKRVVAWQAHLHRAEHFNHPCSRILQFHGLEWLEQQRSFFLNSRNTLWAGQTGTRVQRGRPQVRWESGCELAKLVLSSRENSLQGNRKLSVSSRIREALLQLREGSLLSGFPPLFS